MRRTRGIVGIMGGAALLAAAFAGPAAAETVEEHGPETPENNASLPLVDTYRKSDHLKANILNPKPVCNAHEDYRTVIYKVTDDFSPVGTVSTTNETDSPIPLTQETSRSQTISLTVNGSRTEKVDANLGGTGSGDKGSINAGIAYSLATTVGAEASYSLSWQVGQTIGPYEIPADHTGEATYGFRTVSMTGTQQRCKANGTWSTPTAWRAFVPVKNEVRVNTYANPADSHRP